VVGGHRRCPIAATAVQIGTGCLQEVIVGERALLGQLVDERQSSVDIFGHRDRDRPIQAHHRRRREL
jgi:hypothetical protein